MAFSAKKISFILSRLSNPITRDFARNVKVCGLFFAYLIQINRVACDEKRVEVLKLAET